MKLLPLAEGTGGCPTSPERGGQQLGNWSSPQVPTNTRPDTGRWKSSSDSSYQVNPHLPSAALRAATTQVGKKHQYWTGFIHLGWEHALLQYSAPFAPKKALTTCTSSGPCRLKNSSRSYLYQKIDYLEQKRERVGNKTIPQFTKAFREQKGY